MKEKSFQIKFNQWLKAIYRQLGVFELKVARNNSLPFSAVEEHQIDALWHAKHNVLVYKIPDAGFQNPFDCFCLAGVPAYIVIKYSSGMVYMIDIDVFIQESKTSTIRSVTERKALGLSLYHFNIKSYNSKSPL